MQNKTIKEIAKHLKELKKVKMKKILGFFFCSITSIFFKEKGKIPQIWDFNPLIFRVFSIVNFHITFYFKTFYSEFKVNHKVVGL